MAMEAKPSTELLGHVATQIQVAPDTWTEYASRDETRREHALELQSVFGYRPFTIAEYRRPCCREIGAMVEGEHPILNG